VEVRIQYSNDITAWEEEAAMDSLEVSFEHPNRYQGYLVCDVIDSGLQIATSEIK
jgi:hypothetical protein